MNIASVKTWWQGLNLRERRLVLGLGSAVLVILLYGLIWQPLNESLDSTKKRVASRAALLTWVTENTARYQSAQSATGTKQSTGSLSSIVNRTANQQQLTISRMQPQGESLQVWVDSTSFTQLLFWLEQLVNNEGLQVQAIDLTKGENQGEVRVRRLQLTKQ
jgi:general secretion pathway protein M